jgi:hypothetical protein
VYEYPKSVAIFSQHWSEIVGVIDEKNHVVELIATMKLGQKSPRCLFRCRRKQAHVNDFVGVGIDSAIQPKLLAVQANHLLVDRELIRSDRRNRL